VGLAEGHACGDLGVGDGFPGSSRREVGAQNKGSRMGEWWGGQLAT